MRVDVRKTKTISATALAGALVVSGAAFTSAQDEMPDLSGQSLVVSNWPGYMAEDLPAAFEEATGVPVEVALHDINETIVAKLTAGGDSGIDVAFVSAQYAKALNELGVLEPLDHAQIPNLANLYPEAAQLANDPGNTFSVPYTWGTTGLCYRADLLDFTPSSWWDVLTPREDVKGKVTALSTERWFFLPAQKALGFSMNTTDPDEMQQVKDVLAAAKDDLLAYDNLDFYSRLDSGEAVLAVAWDGWCNGDNANIDWAVPVEGSDLWTDTMVIVATSKNKEAAHAFINHILQPEVHAWTMENILYLAPNQPAVEQLDPALIEAYPSLGATPEQLLQGEQPLDLGEAEQMYTQIKTEVQAQ